jgi:hypothetical protein
LNTLGLLAASVSLSAAAAADGDDALGGRSKGPLRPHPPSASAAALTRIMTHPEEVGRKLLVTMTSPMQAAPYKDCLVLARGGVRWNCSEI